MKHIKNFKVFESLANYSNLEQAIAIYNKDHSKYDKFINNIPNFLKNKIANYINNNGLNIDKISKMDFKKYIDRVKELSNRGYNESDIIDSLIKTNESITGIGILALFGIFIGLFVVALGGRFTSIPVIVLGLIIAIFCLVKSCNETTCNVGVENSFGHEQSQYSEDISSDELILMYFGASWCGPCKRLSPTIDRIESEFDENIKVVRVDIDDNPDLAEEYNINSVPTLILVKSNSVKWRSEGVIDFNEISNIVNKFVSKKDIQTNKKDTNFKKSIKTIVDGDTVNVILDGDKAYIIEN